jgi:muramoyltetrapeptide carboxypeptidase
MIAPAPVRPGDVVAIVAPSSPFEHVLGWRGLAKLRERYRLRFERGIFARSGYFAGDTARRRAELERALLDPDVRAVLAVRGGYGASRFVHTLPWDALARRPKWVVGFSDVTALHVEAARAGVMSLHACNVTALGRWADRRSYATLVDALEAPLASRRHVLSTVVAGQTEGPLFGGNLALLHASAAAGRLSVPDGAVVFLEDVTERPYRIDRMLTTLLVGGHFARARAFVLGDFADCAPGPDGTTAAVVLAELLAPLGVPVAAGLPSGHGRRNDPLVLGARARVVADAAGEATLVVG